MPYGRRRTRSYSRRKYAGRRARRYPLKRGRVFRTGARRSRAQSRSRGHLSIAPRRIRAPVIPNSSFVKLKFYDTETVVSSTTAAPGCIVYRGNSLAPTGSGEALGATSYCQFYSYYQIPACKISIRVKNTDTNNRDLRIGLFARNTSGVTYEANLVDQAGSGIKQRIFYAGSQPRNVGKMNLYMTTARVYGQSQAQLGSAGVGNLVVPTDPTIGWWFYVQYQDAMYPGGSTYKGYPSFQLYVKITYYVKLFNEASYNMMLH